MITKIYSYQLPDMLSKTRFHTKDLVFYFQPQPNFSYQTIFSSRAKLGVVARNKLKRQIRQLLTNLKYQELKLSLLIVVKSQVKNHQSLKDQFSKAQKSLITNH